MVVGAEGVASLARFFHGRASVPWVPQRAGFLGRTLGRTFDARQYIFRSWRCPGPLYMFQAAHVVGLLGSSTS